MSIHGWWYKRLRVNSCTDINSYWTLVIDAVPIEEVFKIIPCIIFVDLHSVRGMDMKLPGSASPNVLDFIISSLNEDISAPLSFLNEPWVVYQSESRDNFRAKILDCWTGKFFLTSDW